MDKQEKQTATITKRYSRKVSYDWQSEEFMTEESRTIIFSSKEEYMAEHDKLAKQVKVLTNRDCESNSELLKQAKADGKLETTND